MTPRDPGLAIKADHLSLCFTAVRTVPMYLRSYLSGSQTSRGVTSAYRDFNPGGHGVRHGRSPVTTGSRRVLHGLGYVRGYSVPPTVVSSFSLANTCAGYSPLFF